MCTDSLAPGARSTAVQCSVSVGGLPWIVQFGGPDAIDQLTPAPAGSGSLITTACAVPVPGASLLLAVIVNPIGEPASTTEASAVFVNVSAGHWTVVVSLACSDEPFDVVSDAVFWYAAQLANAVLLTTCTDSLAPGSEIDRGAVQRLVRRAALDRAPRRPGGDRPVDTWSARQRVVDHHVVRGTRAG